ncbi:hypothetical protein AVEN_259698-1, partial [Araneus ventricosus]
FSGVFSVLVWMEMNKRRHLTVLVTGASGYVAAHIIKLLQEEGYKVRGTVRDVQNEAKVKVLKELCPDATHPLELVEADLLKEDPWKE